MLIKKQQILITKQQIYSRIAEAGNDSTRTSTETDALSFFLLEQQIDSDSNHMSFLLESNETFFPYPGRVRPAVDNEKQNELSIFYGKAQQCLKQDRDFIMKLFSRLEEETKKLIGNRNISNLPVESIRHVPNQSGFHTDFTVPCDGFDAYENFSKISNQKYLLVKVLNNFLSSYDVNTKQTVIYRGYVSPKESIQSIKEGNMYCDEGGYINPSFIPHGMHSHLLQTYFLSAFFSQEDISSFSFREFLTYIGSTGKYWGELMDNVIVPPPQGKYCNVFLRLCGGESSIASLKKGTDNFTSADFLTNFLLGPIAQEHFPTLHRMIVLDCLSLVDSYRERFNQNPEITEKFAKDILYEGPLVFPLTCRGAFNLLEKMLTNYGSPTLEKRERSYREYKNHFHEQPGIKNLPREFANPSEEEIDAWFPDEKNTKEHYVLNLRVDEIDSLVVSDRIKKIVDQDSCQKLLRLRQEQKALTIDEKKEDSIEKCFASASFFSKKVGQHGSKQLLYQRKDDAANSNWLQKLR